MISMINRIKRSTMSSSDHSGRMLACLAIVVVALGLSGCQVDVGGQTLPSAYYLQDDIQYFPAGPEFKLSKEAAALKAYKKEVGAGRCEDGSCR